MADTLVIQIDLEKGDTKTAFNDIEKKAGVSGKKVGVSFSKGFSGVFDVLVGNLGARLVTESISKITQEFGKTVKAAQNLEVIETQFKVLLKSTQAAQKQIADLQQFAATTPFKLDGLAVSTRQLLSFGVAQEEIIPTLRQLGDLAAGAGARIDELTIPFGRLVSTQKLTLIELDKFADRGINLFGTLSKQTGISLGEIRQAISNGKIPFSEFEKALKSLTSEGGLFFGATQKQAKTLEGTLSTLEDNVDVLRGTFGKLFSPILLRSAENSIKLFQTLNESVKGLDINNALKSFREFNTGLITFVIAPLELLVNISQFVGLKVVEGLNAIVSGLGVIGGKIAQFLEFLGVDASQGIKDFAETSNQVFIESAQRSQEAFDNITNFPLSAKLEEQNQQLFAALEEGNTLIGEQVDKTNAKFNTIPESLSQVAQQANKIINAGLAKSISGGVQNIIQSLSKGESAFANFGKFLLSTFGDLSIQLGEFYIAQGLANLALLSVDPTAQIATGAALIALGSILKSFAGGGLSGAGGGAGAGGGGTAGFATEPQDLNSTASEEQSSFREDTNVQLVVQGSIFNTQETANALTNLLNENFDTTGASLTGARLI